MNFIFKRMPTEKICCLHTFSPFKLNLQKFKGLVIPTGNYQAVIVYGSPRLCHTRGMKQYRAINL